MALSQFGAVPHYVPDGWQVKRWIDRNLQFSLPFPPIPQPESERLRAAAFLAENKNIVARLQQPARFPKGYARLFKTDPDWRAKYNAEWVRKRKAKGLPHVIHNPELLPGYRKPVKKPVASVRVSQERKTA